MALEQLTLEGRLTKVEAAIELIKAWEPVEGYYLAFSGGKDSVVIYDLAVKSGVKLDSHYCVSPIDPKEIHQFIRQNYPEVQWDYYAKGFWQTVVKRQMPRRQGRWCCEYIKEAGGEGRVVMVGNRAAESRRRSKQTCYSRDTKGKKIFLRPIISWTTSDVWQYILENNLPYCSLYDEGFKRLGCALCPMTSRHQVKIEILRFPKIARLWRDACDKIVERRLSLGKDSYKTGEELWRWWIAR